MGTITGTSIINKAGTQLTDLTNIRWTRLELLGWLNDAQRQICLMQPNSTSVVASMQLVVGSKQSIPAGGWMLLDVFRNMGSNGTTPGRAIRVVSRKLLDAYSPTWHSAAQNSVTQNFVFDPQDQTSFYVYPPSDGTNYVEIKYAQLPVDLANESNAIVLLDIFEPAMLDYIMYRACSKDAEYAAGVQLASGYWTAFSAGVSAKRTAEEENDPNLTLGPNNPDKPGDQE